MSLEKARSTLLWCAVRMIARGCDAPNALVIPFRLTVLCAA